MVAARKMGLSKCTPRSPASFGWFNGYGMLWDIFLQFTSNSCEPHFTSLLILNQNIADMYCQMEILSVVSSSDLA